MEELQFVAKVFLGAWAGKFRGLELAGGKIDVGEADGRAGRMLGDRGEKIIFARVEHGRVRSGAGRDDANDFAAYDLFTGAGLLHLVANGDFESGADEARDVAVSGVIRHAAHRNRLALFAIAPGQRNLQFARRQQRVFVEEVV